MQQDQCEQPQKWTNELWSKFRMGVVAKRRLVTRMKSDIYPIIDLELHVTSSRTGVLKHSLLCLYQILL